MKISPHAPKSVFPLWSRSFPKDSHEEASPGRDSRTQQAHGLARRRRPWLRGSGGGGLGGGLGRLILGSARPDASGRWEAWDGHWTVLPLLSGL